MTVGDLATGYHSLSQREVGTDRIAGAGQIPYLHYRISDDLAIA